MTLKARKPYAFTVPTDYTLPPGYVWGTSHTLMDGSGIAFWITREADDARVLVRVKADLAPEDTIEDFAGWFADALDDVT